MAAPVAYGIHAVRVLLTRHPQRVRRVLLAGGRDAGRLAEIRALAQRSGVQVAAADDALLAKLAEGERHQGVAAEIVPRAGDPETQLEEALEAAGAAPLLLVLDGVQDPHNLGACLRSADAAGVDAVIAPRDRAVGLTPVACKVASGAAENVPFFQVTNLVRTLDQLRDERRVWVVGTAGEAEALIYDADLRGPLALVLGGEEKGLRRLTREHCDLLVRLPMAGVVESLNVSVAAGVCLFEAVKQRGQHASGATKVLTAP